ncbi:hypothetical protein FB45DRAFT_871476 [Roridomyces roridus]|uniref:Uncharacterized protein n=1 Tax=Roridomyces roridus TaxID=1738132 RepID=A0AAD7FF75_9AGAR|nr:hypothetical protein FB45DRAFT_871476 [Roridomyces roridus]
MEYLESKGPTIFRDASGAEIMRGPQWVILTRARQRLAVVPVPHPQGLDLRNNRVSINGTEERFIYIGPTHSSEASRDPIPGEERTSWRTPEAFAFIAHGSPSEVESETEDAPKPKGGKNKGKKKRGSRKREASDDSEEEDSRPPGKRRATEQRVFSMKFPSILTDELANEMDNDQDLAGTLDELGYGFGPDLSASHAATAPSPFSLFGDESSASHFEYSTFDDAAIDNFGLGSSSKSIHRSSAQASSSRRFPRLTAPSFIDSAPIDLTRSPSPAVDATRAVTPERAVTPVNLASLIPAV